MLCQLDPFCAIRVLAAAIVPLSLLLQFSATPVKALDRTSDVRQATPPGQIQLILQQESFPKQLMSTVSGPTKRRPMDSHQYLEALLTLPELSTVKISPDAKWAAWTWLHAGTAGDVYVVPTDGSKAPMRVTNTQQDTCVVSWSVDSKSVVVAHDKDGNERMRLFRVDLDDPEILIPLTEDAPNYYLTGGQLHPNGKWLVYGANFDVATSKEIEPTWIYRHDINAGKRVPLAKPLKAGNCMPELNKQGTLILYSRNDISPAGQQIWLVDIEGKVDREILNFGSDKKVFASWFPDGRHILFIAETNTHRKLGVYDVTTSSHCFLIDDPARNLEDAFVPEGSNQAVVIEMDKTQVKASLINPESKEEVAVPRADGNLIPLAPLGGKSWVGQYYSSVQPSDLIRFSMSSFHPAHDDTLTRVWERTTLKQQDFTNAEDFHWTSSDDTKIHGWLYRAKDPRGTIVYIHGGPTYHVSDELDIELQFLAHQGFNVFTPNYRGSTGYGLKFQESIKKDGWGGHEQDDMRTGIEALIAQGIACKGRIGITGTSYGGYSSWFAITHFPKELVAAAAPICGMTDLTVDYETTRPDLRTYSEEMLGGSPSQVPERYKERSPINFVNQIKGHLLIVQGLEDPNVTPENVRQVEAALKKHGIKYEILTFKDEGHGIHKPHNHKILYLRLAEFFERAFSKQERVLQSVPSEHF